MFLDYIIAFGKTFEEPLQRLEQMFAQLEKSGLEIKGSEEKFSTNETLVWGILSENKEWKCICREWQQLKKSPSYLKEVREGLALVGFWKKFLPGFGKTAEHLSQLLKTKKKYLCTKNCGKRMQELNGKLLSAPILGNPINRYEYILTTDAYLTCISSVWLKSKKE